ncbi:MAG TPA: MFS transporter, partial [Actinomycetota bacterium]|nr:MFS transporter [Actinomycetota bacterium]
MSDLDAVPDAGRVPPVRGRGRRPRIESDLRRILAVQALRAFAYGFGVVVLGTVLGRTGASAVEVSLVFTSMLAGMALTSILVAMTGDRFGRRRVYVGLLAVMGIAGTIYATTGRVWVLALVALTGTMSTDANESGPISSLEQAMIGQAPGDTRVRVFGRYNATAYLSGALGSLAAGGPEFLRRVWTGAPADRRWLLVLPLVAALCVAIARGLSPAVEAGGSPRARRALERSRGNVRRLSSLFALDSFAGGFVVSSFIVFWFARRYGVGPGLMSIVLFAAGLLQAGSSILAARLGSRFGLLNTMVFTHLPSNILLLLVPLMPTAGAAIALLLVRFALSQMDVPTR